MDQKRLRTFVLGGVIGALAGILLAPRSGREMRGSIMDRAGEARERGREGYFQAQERMQERISGAREGAYGPPGRTSERIPNRATEPVNEPSAAPGHPPGGDHETEAPRPPLRDVSWDAAKENHDETPEKLEDPEELRRRVSETRARLRARLDADGGADGDPGE